MTTYDKKYKPYFIPADAINAVNVQNNQKVTTTTEYSSLKDKGKTITDKKDNYYVEIHYQLKGDNLVGLEFLSLKIGLRRNPLLLQF